jgi:hypothetical protein
VKDGLSKVLALLMIFVMEVAIVGNLNVTKDF